MTQRSQQIAEKIVDAILARRIAPGERLGEQALADLFDVSRTVIREAMARLAARGIVEVTPRRGWFVVEPSRQEADDAFAARVAIETGMLQSLDGPLPKPAVRTLRQHVARERAAIRDGDPGERSFLLGDFHVCLAECAGNPVLAEILRDLTARTTLVATLYQSTHEASASCADHVQIVAALERGDAIEAVRLMRAHIGTVAAHLNPERTPDPLASLRSALQPEPREPSRAATAPRRTRPFSKTPTKEAR